MAQRLFGDAGDPRRPRMYMTEAADADMRDAARAATVVRAHYGDGVVLHRCVQVHGTAVTVLHGPDGVAEHADCDGLVTQSADQVLAVRIADCVPVYLWDDAGTTVGLLHAGWRGTAAGILQAGWRVFTETFALPPNALHMGLGPAIGSCCFEVGPEVAAAFEAWSQAVTDAGGGKSTVDLKHVLRAQWAALGGVVGNVHDTPVCTRCDRRYYSYRRDPDAGRALALIGLV